jgi:hypothetical protein
LTIPLIFEKFDTLKQRIINIIYNEICAAGRTILKAATPGNTRAAAFVLQ